MRAIVMREFGPPAVLAPVDVPEPVAAAGQVVVDVHYASITFVETQVRAGRAPNPAMAPRLPAILGNGVGGIVEGERVITTTGGSGGYAERVAVPVDGLIAVPDELTLSDAVALLADGRTATALVRTAAIQPGETVLVEAAAGGVGSLLVQLARNAGAHVVAAASGARKLELARELGAHVAVDYTRPGWADEVGRTDVVFDGVGVAAAGDGRGDVGRAAFETLRPGGRFLPFGLAAGAFTPVSDEEAAERGVAVLRDTGVTPETTAGLTRAALAEAAAGRLRPVVGQIRPLDQAAAAHAAIEARATLGKTLLAV